MKIASTIRPLVAALLLHPACWALDGVSIAGGSNLDTSDKDFDFLQISIRDSFNGRWFESSTGSVVTNWEASVTRWNPQSRENWVGALGVAVRYEFSKTSVWAPYIEYGLGGALVSNLKISDNRRFSTHFQFANRLEIGNRFGPDLENELGLVFWHYSNAYIKEPNPGVDFISLRYTRRF
ncbi:MAG: hypothetical protein H6R07_646 [Proteobacteria bacterium]|nr:hypothetical protein [Pseudomonadota bacterium]